MTETKDSQRTTENWPGPIAICPDQSSVIRCRSFVIGHPSQRDKALYREDEGSSLR